MFINSGSFWYVNVKKVVECKKLKESVEIVWGGTAIRHKIEKSRPNVI